MEQGELLGGWLFTAYVIAAMTPYMKLDKYGRTTIRNIYYDTDT